MRLARPILILIAAGVLILGMYVCGLGIYLARPGSSGMTDIRFFGQTFSSSSVGIAAIFLGTTMVAVVLTELLRRLKDIAALP